MTDNDIEDIVVGGKGIRKSHIISASRRTDIPAFYMPQVLQALKQKCIDVKLPYGSTSHVSLDPEDVKCIVWWSKDYSEWIKAFDTDPRIFLLYKHVFNFTINGCDKLEKGVRSSLDDRIAQVVKLAGIFGVECIKFRFDPITVYIDSQTGEVMDNLENFEYIVRNLSHIGVKDIIFAFCNPYDKVVHRMKKRGKIAVALDTTRKKKILDKLIPIADKNQMILRACSVPDVLGYKNKIFSICCIDGPLIEKITKTELVENKKDPNQRTQCNCAVSIDIGSYEMVCKHSCDYCYAHPS